MEEAPQATEAEGAVTEEGSTGGGGYRGSLKETKPDEAATKEALEAKSCDQEQRLPKMGEIWKFNGTVDGVVVYTEPCCEVNRDGMCC